MAQVSNVNYKNYGTHNFLARFSGTAPNNEFMEIRIILDKSSNLDMASFWYAPAGAQGLGLIPENILSIVEFKDTSDRENRDAMLDDVAHPLLKDRVRNFITSAIEMAATYGNSGGEEMEGTEIFTRDLRERCIRLMERFPVNKRMNNVHSRKTGSDDPYSMAGAFGGPVATPSSTSYTDRTTF